MKNSSTWMAISLIILVVIFSLTLIFGDNYLFPVLIFSVAFVVLLSLLYRWKSDRLAQSMSPDESLVARGLVSESTFDETPAILARGRQNSYRIHIAGSRGSQVILSVSPKIHWHANPRDLKGYLELHTNQGIVHFAPRNSFLVASQPGYAHEILDVVLSDEVAISDESHGA